MISVIGAGPIGSYVAYLLARNGEKVNLYEEHDVVGRPVQCTGIVSKTFKDVIRLRDEFLINKFKVINIRFKDERLRIRNNNFLLDREKFDNFLFNLAKEEGVKIFLKHEFKDIKDGKARIDNKIIKFDKLVGADGPHSKVANSIGLYGKRDFVFGIQARVKGEYSNEVDVFFDKGKFGWIVPEGDKVARIGVFGDMNDFKDLIKDRKIITYQSGVVPIYDYRLRSMKNNVYLVGDAATQVKATTYGGLVPGLIAGEELSRAILSDLNYHKLWKKRIGKELFFSLLLRKKLDKLDEKDRENLFNLFKGRIRKVIEEGSRDFPSKFIIKLILKEPRLIKFAFK